MLHDSLGAEMGVHCKVSALGTNRLVAPALDSSRGQGAWPGLWKLSVSLMGRSMCHRAGGEGHCNGHGN